MSRMQDRSVVERQYASTANLDTRRSIHERYSTNKQGFGNWIFSNYRIEPGAKVLELGCGTGEMWKNRGPVLSACSRIVLSDLSEGMVAAAKENVGRWDTVEYRVLDIQEIPYEDETFDLVIANMMLYHVPDIGRALAEVRRVLKKGGRFYCATYGEHGIVECLSRLLSPYGVEDNINRSFTLQNGSEISCLRTRKHCPPTDDFVRSLRQSSLPASKDACAAFPCAGPKSPGGGCTAVLAQRSVPRVPWKGRAEYWMYFQALYGVLWGRSPSQNQCFLIRRQRFAQDVFQR